MGRRGPLPKDPSKLHGHRPVAAPRRPVQAVEFTPPDPVAEWRDDTKTAWATYWGSDLAGMALAVDTPAIRRLFSMYDQYARAMEVVGKALVVKGSTGQIRANPLADYALKLDSAILRLENELGLTPAGRNRLGIQIRLPIHQPTTAPSVTDSPYAHLKVAK
jgi:P27 family predicted phage terminase small subunit